jgi:hypothetical protein
MMNDEPQKQVNLAQKKCDEEQGDWSHERMASFTEFGN